MAQLKDLIVNGASRFIGDAFATSLQITSLKIPSTSGGTSYTAGTSGYVIKSNGASVYWAPDNNTTYSAFTGKPTGNQTPSFGGTFTIQQISQNAAGQVSGTDRTVTIPSTAATTATAGLMSAADKVKLLGIATSANNYSLPTATTAVKGGIKVGTGLSMNGEVLNHSNGVTAQTTQAIYPIKIDAQGHISAYGSAVNGIPTGGSSGQFLGWDSSGKAKWVANPNSNTHRPIQLNGTEILASNVTPLNFINGSGITITNSSGSLTIAGTIVTFKDWTVA